MAEFTLGARLCPVCGGATHDGFAVCYCCATLVRQLNIPLTPVMVVADYRLGDPMHRRLRGYKDAPVTEVRHRHLTELAAILDDWLAANRSGMRRRFGAPWELVATVPSSRRPAGAPADGLVSHVTALAGCHAAGLLVRGTEDTGHLKAARGGFVLSPTIDAGWLLDRRVLVVDDSIVTGARAQSAVAALRLAGARVVGVMAVGRMVSGLGWPRGDARLDRGDAPTDLHRAPAGRIVRPAPGGGAVGRDPGVRRLLSQ
jgi:predicted amidophosphoribosyltransferase